RSMWRPARRPRVGPATPGRATTSPPRRRRICTERFRFRWGSGGKLRRDGQARPQGVRQIVRILGIRPGRELDDRGARGTVDKYQLPVNPEAEQDGGRLGTK